MLFLAERQGLPAIKINHTTNHRLLLVPEALSLR